MKQLYRNHKNYLLIFKRYLILTLVVLVLAPVIILSATGCSSQRTFIVPDPIPDDRHPVPAPEQRSTFNDFADFIDKQFILQGEQLLDFSQTARTVSGKPKQALNVNAFDEVQNSSWFTNRNAMYPMSLEEIKRGPDQGNGPDTSSTWIIKRAKAEGVTPGFHIKDSRGDRYVIKFDPIGYSGLNSGAEVVGTKLFYAAGYNTPENYIVYFRPEILQMGDDVKILDEKGRNRLMNEHDLQEILERVEVKPDGLIRASASKYIPGKILGPFKFESTIKDDPNDFIRHEHRRELRGQKIFAIWVNHIDAKAANSMDAYIGEEGKGYVKHFMMDFGTTLGSGGRGPQPKYRGYENEIDPHAIGFKVATFGLWPENWDQPDTVLYSSVGRFRPDNFHPESFKFIFPNPAYDNCTNLDAFWGAKLVASFTDEQIAAAVSAGQYEKDAAKYLTDILISRRDIISRYYFNKVNPLDRFEISDGDLSFMDWSIEAGLEDKAATSYKYEIRQESNDLIADGETVEPSLPLSLSGNLDPGKQVEITWFVKRASQEKKSKWIKVYLEWNDDVSEYELIGLRRQE